MFSILLLSLALYKPSSLKVADKVLVEKEEIYIYILYKI